MKRSPLLLLLLILIATCAASQTFRIENGSKEIVITTNKQIIEIHFKIDRIEIDSSVQVIIGPAESSTAVVGIDYLFHEPAKAEQSRNSQGPILLTYPKDSSFKILLNDTNQRDINLSIRIKTKVKELIFNESVKINVKKGSIAPGADKAEPSSKLIAWRFRPEFQDIKVHKEGEEKPDSSGKSKKRKQLPTIDIRVPGILGKSSTGIKVRVINALNKNEVYYADDVEAADFVTGAKRIYLNKDSDTGQYILLGDILSFMSMAYENGTGAKIDTLTQVITVWVPE